MFPISPARQPRRRKLSKGWVAKLSEYRVVMDLKFPMAPATQFMGISNPPR
jgi:hypothetical protein